MSPDGAWVYYVILPSTWHPGDIVNVMRASLAGGPPQLAVSGRPVIAVSCSRPPATRCIVIEYDRKQFTFYDLGLSQGEGRALLSIPNPGEPDELTRYFEPLAFPTTCRITPNGSFIACANVDKDPVVFRFLPLGSGQERDVTVKGAVHLTHDFGFGPDGRGIYTYGLAAHGEGALYVDPKGDVHELVAVRGNDTARLLISPDGQHLAFDKWNTATASNVWLIENF